MGLKFERHLNSRHHIVLTLHVSGNVWFSSAYCELFKGIRYSDAVYWTLLYENYIFSSYLLLLGVLGWVTQQVCAAKKLIRHSHLILWRHSILQSHSCCRCGWGDIASLWRSVTADVRGFEVRHCKSDSTSKEEKFNESFYCEWLLLM